MAPHDPGPGCPEEYLAVLRERCVMSLATAEGGVPYSAPVFYAVADGGRSLVFLSDPASRHAREITRNPKVSAGIYLETREAAEIRGLQIVGEAGLLAGEEEARLWRVYEAAYPQARFFRALVPGDRLYALRVQWAKLTDNRRGFGHKQEWRF